MDAPPLPPVFPQWGGRERADSPGSSLPECHQAPASPSKDTGAPSPLAISLLLCLYQVQMGPVLGTACLLW
jgi:hypothetical protein